MKFLKVDRKSYQSNNDAILYVANNKKVASKNTFCTSYKNDYNNIAIRVLHFDRKVCPYYS